MNATPNANSGEIDMLGIADPGLQYSYSKIQVSNKLPYAGIGGESGQFPSRGNLSLANIRRRKK